MKPMPPGLKPEHIEWCREWVEHEIDRYEKMCLDQDPPKEEQARACRVVKRLLLGGGCVITRLDPRSIRVLEKDDTNMSDAHEKAVNEVADIYPPPFNRPYGVIREYLERVSTEGPVIVVDGKVVELTDIDFAFLPDTWTEQFLHAAREVADE